MSSIVLLKLESDVKFTISVGKKFKILKTRSEKKDFLTLFLLRFLYSLYM